MKKELPLIIGIDPGTTVGVAVWDIQERRLVEWFERDMIDAWAYLLDLRTRHELFVVLEDARLMRRRKQADSAARAQGYGSIKRDSILWHGWLAKNSIPHLRQPPKKTYKKREGLDEFLKYYTPKEPWMQKPGFKMLVQEDHMRDAYAMVESYTEPGYLLALEKSKNPIQPRKKAKSWEAALKSGKIKTVKYENDNL